MPYIMGQISVSGTVPIFNIPPGPCNCTFYNVTAVNAFIGVSTAVSTVSGLQCHSIPVNFFGYMGSKGAQFYATTGGASTAVINYLIATDQ